MIMNMKHILCAAGVLALSTGVAAAATARVATDLNVRAGQGTGYPVVAVMPAGAIVDVSNCGDGWCYVHDYGGYASASYLDGADVVYGGTTYVAPPAVIVAPRAYVAPRYYDPAPRRFIRRGIRAIQREVRQDRRQDLRQDRRENRREVRQDDRRQERREARQERRENRRNN